MDPRMIRSRRIRGAVAAAAAATVLTIAAPATSNAQPIGPTGQLDPATAAQLNDLASQPWMPEKGGVIIKALVGFFTYTEGDGGVDLPDPAKSPAITQFAYPTFADNCVNGTGISVGTALVVPGPAATKPVIGPGQSLFVFTGLGTGKALGSNMTVQWVNVNTGKTGTTPLQYSGINPDGPATLTGVADTGSGRVLGVLNGGVTVTNKESGPSTCGYAPTVVDFSVH